MTAQEELANQWEAYLRKNPDYKYVKHYLESKGIS